MSRIGESGPPARRQPPDGPTERGVTMSPGSALRTVPQGRIRSGVALVERRRAHDGLWGKG
ncbi:hypothetical protein Rumeso_04290 [Rubellimicrobium mesophilum DSM 19309]|uniref:Uncharacterized protein n=1 Tax=Rubellimicrobium mesophilum DSM 19309 TaxID=442562 RepID=A0A017HJ96_9RHOB|nr:hypothetical protein Rumeso_04290 [Rubellimicrobium mesophilum DSM 19309]